MTGATVSSQIVVDAVNERLVAWRKYTGDDPSETCEPVQSTLQSSPPDEPGSADEGPRFPWPTSGVVLVLLALASGLGRARRRSAAPSAGGTT